jgi:hypothetical protein
MRNDTAAPAARSHGWIALSVSAAVPNRSTSACRKKIDGSTHRIDANPRSKTNG